MPVFGTRLTEKEIRKTQTRDNDEVTDRDSELSYEVSVKTTNKPLSQLSIFTGEFALSTRFILPSLEKLGCVQLRQTRLTLSYNSSLLCSSPSHEEGQRGAPRHSSTLFLPESRDSPHSDLLPLPYPLSHSPPFPFSSKSLARWHEAPRVSIDFGDVPHLTLPPCWWRRRWCGFRKAAAV